MENIVQTFLNKLGYSISEKPYSIISLCDSWYRNELIEDFHRRETVQGEKYELDRTGFAKRLCSDEANLCEIVEINSDNANDLIETVFKENNFLEEYRKQLELVSAEGTAGAYVAIEDAELLEDNTIQGGRISIVYCYASNIIPITVKDDIVTECAFSGTNYSNGKKEIYLTIFTKENGIYLSRNVKFDERGVILSDVTIRLGDVKPFSILRNAEVNNIRYMEVFGYPKLYAAIPALKVLDLSWNLLRGDLDKGDKLMLVNEILCGFDDSGRPKPPTKLSKKIFVLLGRKKLPDQKEFVQEYNPLIRIDELTKCIELALSMLSMQFGFGNKKYTFENGQIKTATEYIGARQDAMQELNKQRGCAETYIREIAEAVVWFSNYFYSTSYSADDVLIEFDDSYIEDKNTKLESMKNDALSFYDIPILKVWYLMEKYNCTEEEARKYIQDGASISEGDDEPLD